MNDDLFQVLEEEDGTLTISWDDTDPRLAFLNVMTPKQQEDFFVDAINRKLDELKSDYENDTDS